jgi:DNA repair exonuclease SbcCD ATPase subunit
VIRNFQSLRKMTVELGRFTVITGPTGTGKSALVRAVRLLAFNASGTSYITRGEKTVVVGMDGDDWRIEISRGAKNSYTVFTPDHQDGQVFTKLQGKVPEQASSLMRLGDVNFSGQFDMPYLLDTTGSEVARVLGKLTNVTLLYKAAQEANRRRLASGQLLKTRQADLAALYEQAQQYATLPAENAAVGAAEAALARLQAVTGQRQRLWDLTSAVARALATRDMLADQALPEPPSLDQLEALALKRQRLRHLFGQLDTAHMAWVSAGQQVMEEARREDDANKQLAQYTAQWDVCPTCGQPVKKEHAHGS